MQQRFNDHGSARKVGAAALAIIALATLSACGGGGGGDSTPATVSAMSVAATKYGTPALVTVTGTHLGNLSLQASGCKGITRLTAAPTASTDTTAYYSCTPSGAYSSNVIAVSNGGTLSTQPLVVLPPVVTMTVTGGGNPTVNGTIVFNLRGNLAPVTVDNFLAYVNAGFYNGTIFHRVVPGFVVQGGGYTAATSGSLPAPKTVPYGPINLELTGGSNVQWTAAMARTSDDNSATSQFFFNLLDNSDVLDKSATTDGYAVFADVSSSAAVIQSIVATAPCTALVQNGVPIGDGSCVPIPNVKITTATQTQ